MTDKFESSENVYWQLQKIISTHITHISRPVLVKSGVRHIHTVIMNNEEYRENKFTGSRTLLWDINGALSSFYTFFVRV